MNEISKLNMNVTGRKPICCLSKVNITHGRARNVINDRLVFCHIRRENVSADTFQRMNCCRVTNHHPFIACFRLAVSLTYLLYFNRK